MAFSATKTLARAVGEIAQALDIGDVVAGPVAGAPKEGRRYRQRRRPFDGFDAEIGILGQSEEFERVLGRVMAFSTQTRSQVLRY